MDIAKEETAERRIRGASGALEYPFVAFGADIVGMPSFDVESRTARTDGVRWTGRSPPTRTESGRAEIFELTRTRGCTTFDRERAGALDGPPTMDAGRDDDAGEYTLVAVTFATIYSNEQIYTVSSQNLQYLL